MALRVLFLGENWYGSCARACCYALRRLGCDVMDVDAQIFFPQLRHRSSRIGLRFFASRLAREYNDRILEKVSSFKPDVFLAYKAPYVYANTLREVRRRGIALYNYYPDTSTLVHGRYLGEALPEYDCIFHTKRFGGHDLHENNLSVREVVFLPHGYDPELHRAWRLESRDRELFGSFVSVIATYTVYKERTLAALVKQIPDLDLKIWGGGWSKIARTSPLKKFVVGYPLEGISYAKALRAARINLAVMSGTIKGASQGDETTTRTYEIPACGGFMLHERTDEVLELFEEGKEVACFGSSDELAEKVQYYLAQPEERARIAAAGHKRCVPAYSYENRMAEILKWHREFRA